MTRPIRSPPNSPPDAKTRRAPFRGARLFLAQPSRGSAGKGAFDDQHKLTSLAAGDCRREPVTKDITLLQKVSTDMLLKPMSYIGAAISEWRLLQQLEGHMVPKIISFDVRVGFLKSVEMLKEVSALLSMHASLRVIEAGWEEAVAQIAPNRPLSRQELQNLIVYADKVVSVFVADATALSLMALAPGHADYSGSETPLFGKAVDDAFPSAAPRLLMLGVAVRRVCGPRASCI
ncbi:hypothetical protein [Brevundimonas variabilis]|uniref:Uncharacterized protein n=1 Tax=Brevundimonas variabilis TaxID=74312 RepID=A0A7W9FES1_9CAUL|nr:hypothetical protein [Brevundimonas variabilis]MBB5746575.1 hypothetical protein [Brevundimonas variabilis]